MRAARLKAIACGLAVLLLGLGTFAGAPAEGALPSHSFFVDLGVEPASARGSAVAAPLPDGDVLIAGGADGPALRTAEIFDPTTLTFTAIPALTRLARVDAMAAPLPDGRVLIAGGIKSTSFSSAETFDPTTGTFSDVSEEMAVPRVGGVAAPLPDGDVLITDGAEPDLGERTAELFHPATGTFTTLEARPTQERDDAVAATLPDGRVLIFSGQNDYLESAEVFDPATDTFSALGSSSEGPGLRSAGALLPDGKMLVAGGLWNLTASDRAGIYDPGAGAFSLLPREGGMNLTTPRESAVAASLPDGTVLIAGGSWPEARQSAELFVSAPEIGSSGTDLGPRLVGEPSPPSSVVITNVGAQRLRIEAVSLVADDHAFDLVSDTCSGQELLFHETCAIGVRFTPTVAGTAHATLDFTDDEPVPTSVSLTGTGTLPAPPAPPEQSGQESQQSTMATPPAPAATPEPRHGISTGCATKAMGSKAIQVICHIHLSEGAWEARLRRSGHIVARRRLGAGSRRLVFRRPVTSRASYRLQVVPIN
jgi:hypothetical protein